MPIFPISPMYIPFRTVTIIEQLLAHHLEVMISMTMVLQQCLLYFYITSTRDLIVEPLFLPVTDQSLPVLSVSLATTLLLGPCYEAYHRIHKLAAYIHPYRTTDWLIWSLHFPNPQGYLELNNEQELKSLLHPLLSPNEAILPYTYSGSSIPDLTYECIECYLYQDDVQVKATLLPNSRSSYFSTLPLRTNFTSR
jgi:hypothetical protein